MPTYSETKTLPYSVDQMFDLVIDIEKYPDFLPWCIDCKIIKRNDDWIYANLVIGYKLFKEWFLSKIHIEDDKTIQVEYVNGPLRYLSNKWKFIPHDDGSSTVDFYVDFEFKNAVFEKIMGVFFNEIAKRMVSAFVERADQLYHPLSERFDSDDEGSSQEG
ncbi:MAG: type II toxin-antitoxin system RatA family toxin [Alphaproteobacteria bacterium]|nr:type II toxin-antitoxin system RatA family toxin [Alphaproteobacteria bacterium]MCB1551510.1 type II toxin-antitoxin system RatA family toxin [Alphaproteobacteria bacterium]MCB9984846.1 type II toxin-antitoxin system RatA family toxin [Micavibrio sp.]HRK97238.1 type II toxin-antitoxin system RatA family toxin [Alphaproteobacteria bacterium]